MDSFTVTATELKNNTCDILNRVTYCNCTCFVTRHGKIVAELTAHLVKNLKKKPFVTNKK